MTKQQGELHWYYIGAQIEILKTLMFVFQKTKDGEHYYVNWSEDYTKQVRKETSWDIMMQLKRIRDMERSAYLTLRRVYKEELLEVFEVYRAFKTEKKEA